MKMGNQGRPGFTPPKPQPEAQVEVEKFDPAMLAPQPRPPRPPRATEEDIMANAEPINLKAPLRSATPPPQKPAEAPMTPPKPQEEPLEKMVPDSLIARLEAKFGIQPETFHEAVLEAMGHKLNVTFRVPSYDDYIWSMAIIERKINAQEDESLLQTTTQRNNMLQHLVDCRAIVKLEGEWLWQVFKREAEIKTILPTWDGKWDTIPDFIRGTMAVAVYDLFRKRLNADLLFALEAVVKRIEKPETVKADGEDEDEDTEDPSSAA